ncbi:MAG TPA: hypothetical protein VFZ32_22080 [Micromonosporaceae bacterium]
MIVVTGVVTALAVLAVAGPVALFGPALPTPPVSRSGDLVLPPPESGWERVGDPLRTGIRAGPGGVEVVLWFERRDNDVTRLRTGERDPATGRVTDRDRIRDPSFLGDRPGSAPGMYVPPGHWSFVTHEVQSGGAVWWLYVGDAVRIDIMVAGQPRPAKLARLSEDPRFVAFWLDGVTGNLGGDGVKAYDADGKPLPMRHPPDLRPPAPGEDIADFDPVDAPRLGAAIPTGEKRLDGTGLYPAPFPGETGVDPSGEVVLSFHGEDGYAGVVHSFRDPDTGEITGSYSGTRAHKLPFDKGPGPDRGEIGLGGGKGRTMAYGIVVGSVDRLTATVDRFDMNIRWQAWSEDPDVVVWWLVIPTDKVEEDDAMRVDLTIRYRDGSVDRDAAVPLD